MPSVHSIAMLNVVMLSVAVPQVRHTTKFLTQKMYIALVEPERNILDECPLVSFA
jgi:hypothetical protein